MAISITAAMPQPTTIKTAPAPIRLGKAVDVFERRDFFERVDVFERADFLNGIDVPFVKIMEPRGCRANGVPKENRR